MSALTVEHDTPVRPTVVRERPAVRELRPTRRTAAPSRQRRPGPGVGPRLRPGTGLGPAPVGPAVRVRACAPEVAPRLAHPSVWRLTERGIAVILVTGLMIVAAAVAVVGLTALRVTSDGFQAHPSSVTVQR